jgi:geranylgeranyl diphosphate/geranylgeranyl-bacteriochlorophyllide a reductase
VKVVVVGANCGGSIAAGDLAATGAEVVLLERDLKRKKPCGGAIPPRALTEFGIPRKIVERKVRRAAVIGPSGSVVEMGVRGTVARDDDFIIMLTREILDRTLREKAQDAGADLREATFVSQETQSDGSVRVKIRYRDEREEYLTCDALIGADGAGSSVAKSVGRPAVRHASAIQERLELPPDAMEYYEDLAELYLGDDISPDFYGWVFPKSDHVAIGTGCRPEHANRSYSFLEGVKARAGHKLRGAKRILLEGHPLPMSRNKKLVFGRVLLVGDAGGMVAHTSGEGIYFSMAAGRLAAQTLGAFFGYGEKLQTYEKRWQQRFGAMFDFLELLEKVSYTTNTRREWFTDMCRVRTVQELTFDSYLFKDMATVKPTDHIDLAYEGVINAVINWWIAPKAPLYSSPPKITAKEAILATRSAISAGVSVEEPA